MNAAEFRQAVQIARSKNVDLSMVDDDHLFGFGLSTFDPVHTTLAAVAKTIRWQAGRMDGTWDHEAISQIGMIGRRKFLIVPGDEEVVGQAESQLEARNAS